MHEEDNQIHVPPSFLAVYADSRQRLREPASVVRNRYELCDAAVAMLDRCGVELMLCGHIHVSYVGTTLDVRPDLSESGDGTGGALARIDDAELAGKFDIFRARASNPDLRVAGEAGRGHTRFFRYRRNA